MSLGVSLLLGSGSSSFLSLLLESGLGLDASPQIEGGGGIADALDGALLGKFSDDGARNGAVHLVLLRQGGAGDDEDFGDFRRHLCPALLVEEDIEVELILYLDFGP